MNRPLANKTVLVTRPGRQAGELVAALQEHGANVILVPTIEIAPPADFSEFDQALHSLEGFDWAVFTSVNAVEAVSERMSELNLTKTDLTGISLAAVGSATAEALAERFRAPDVVPADYVSEAVGQWLGDVRGKRILLPQADLARRNLQDLLTEAGASVTRVTAYRIVRPTGEVNLPDETPDYITLTSSESARSAEELLRRCGRGAWLSQAALVCIGPITAATVRELGYTPAAVATTYTSHGLLEALLAHTGQEVSHA